MAERIGELNQVAHQGNINDFYNLIRNDVKLLEHIDELPFVDTLLHISVSAGQIPFSIEMMILKPSFVNKRNPNGDTPIHLALINGRTEMVRQFLQHNADLARVKGRECMTPLHYEGRV
uniref:Ankyrin repeat-containing protein n=1 Tax=Quercus lobata TaxID=97700 RepID=A0A7N2KLG6_QUELO